MCMIESVRDAFRIIVPLLVRYKVFVWLAPLIVRLRPVDQTRQRVMIEGFNTLSSEHKLVIFFDESAFDISRYMGYLAILQVL